MKMTYKQLAAKIAKLTPEQQNSDVTIHATKQDEYVAITALEESSTDVLDEGHPILLVEL